MRDYSGKGTVLVGLGVIALVMGGLYYAFLGERAKYQETADWGRANALPLVEEWARDVPPGASKEDWGLVMDETRELARRVVTLGMLGRPEMEKLRDDWAQRVARTRPESLQGEVTLFWADMLSAAGPRIVQEDTSKQRALPPPGPIAEGVAEAMLVNRMIVLVPEGWTRARWESALAKTRGLLAMTAPGPDPQGLAERVARATPRDSLSVLEEEVAKRGKPPKEFLDVEN